MAALGLSKELYVEYGAAFALALRENPPGLKLSRTIWKAASGKISDRFSHLPTLRALLALNQGEPAKAIELLQIAVPYDLGRRAAAYMGTSGPSIRSMCVARPIWPAPRR